MKREAFPPNKFSGLPITPLKLTPDQMAELDQIASKTQMSATDVIKAEEERRRTNPDAPPMVTLAPQQGWLQWGTEAARYLVRIRFAATQTASTPPPPINVTVPPILPLTDDAASSSTQPNNDSAPPADNTSILASVYEIRPEDIEQLPNEAQGTVVADAAVHLASVLENLAPDTMHTPVTRTVDVSAAVHEEEPIVVSPIVASAPAPEEISDDEEALGALDAPDESMPLVEADEVEDQTAAVQAEIEQRLATEAAAQLQAQEAERLRLEELTRIENARREALAAAEQERTLLLQREREEAERKKKEAADAAADYQRRWEAQAALGRLYGM